MRRLELIIPIFKTRTQVTPLSPEEKRIVINKVSGVNDLAIVLAKSHHKKYNSISCPNSGIIELNTEGFDFFWIERPRIGLFGRIKLSVL